MFPHHSRQILSKSPLWEVVICHKVALSYNDPLVQWLSAWVVLLEVLGSIPAVAFCINLIQLMQVTIPPWTCCRRTYKNWPLGAQGLETSAMNCITIPIITAPASVSCSFF